MTRKASIIFPGSEIEYTVLWESASKYHISEVQNLIKSHGCRVRILEGFSEKELFYLSQITEVIICQNTHIQSDVF
jgi:hypothetical protein